MSKKRALILASSYGHYSLGLAFEDVLKKAGWETRVFKPEKKDASGYYNVFYKYSPRFFSLPYKLSKSKTVTKLLKSYGKEYYSKVVSQQVEDFNPDLIVVVHFFYHMPIKRLGINKRIKTINFVYDPITPHQIEFFPEVENLVYSKKTTEVAKKYKVPNKNIVISGWPVRAQFYKNYNKQKILKKLGFSKDIFTILIIGGSVGTNAILKIIPALFQVKKPVQVMFVAGKNKTLFKIGKILEKIFKSLDSNNIKFKSFKFVDNLAPLMKMSDLVVGKGGPNLIFETVATGTPFFVISHISGQENGNLDLVEDKKLGFVEESREKSVKLLLKIIEDPSILEKYKKSIDKEFKYNKNFEKVLLKTVK